MKEANMLFGGLEKTLYQAIKSKNTKVVQECYDCLISLLDENSTNFELMDLAEMYLWFNCQNYFSVDSFDSLRKKYSYMSIQDYELELLERVNKLTLSIDSKKAVLNSKEHIGLQKIFDEGLRVSISDNQFSNLLKGNEIKDSFNSHRYRIFITTKWDKESLNFRTLLTVSRRCKGDRDNYEHVDIKNGIIYVNNYPIQLNVEIIHSDYVEKVIKNDFFEGVITLKSMSDENLSLLLNCNNKAHYKVFKISHILDNIAFIPVNQKEKVVFIDEEMKYLSKIYLHESTLCSLSQSEPMETEFC